MGLLVGDTSASRNRDIENHSVSGIIVNNGSSCDLMYISAFTVLGLRKQDLKVCGGKSFLVLNDSSTRPCGALDLPVSFGEGNNKRVVNAKFLIVPCESVYKYIMGRSIMTTLDTTTSMIHLKMKYHNDLSKLVVVTNDLRGNCLIHG